MLWEKTIYVHYFFKLQDIYLCFVNWLYTGYINTSDSCSGDRL